MGDATQFYRSYLLRVWRAGSADAPIWRLLIEDVQSRERYGFARLEQLVAFLREQADSACTSGPVPADSEEQHPA
jgi:hypothetical protein